jgi:hypothetical protein
MLVVNFGATPRTVTIEHNRVFNYNNSGITIFAEAYWENPALANLTVHVLDNTIIGAGPNEVIDQWGVFFGGYNFAEPQSSISGSIKDLIQDQITVGGIQSWRRDCHITHTMLKWLITSSKREYRSVAQQPSAQIAGTIYGPQDVFGSTGSSLEATTNY